MKNRTDQRIPTVPRDLLEFLEAKYPDRLPEGSVGIEEIRREQGRVSVVKFLRRAYEIQNPLNP